MRSKKAVACLATVFVLAQGCTADDQGAKTSTTPHDADAIDATLFELGGGVVQCTQLDSLVETETDAAPLLTSCLGLVANGGTLSLKPGTYTVKTQVNLARSITLTTAGRPGTERCGIDAGHGCAELRAGAGLEVDFGMLNISGSAIVDHIVLNGRKDIRAAARSRCAGGANTAGMNAIISGSGVHFENSAAINAACGSGLVVGSSADIVVSNSTFAYNGTHDQYMFWSDGLTVIQVQRGQFNDNLFIENSDVDMIFGGCTDCSVARNTIQHTGNFSSSSFAGMMIQAFLQSSDGVYTGSVFQNNSVDCGPGKGCGFAYYIGSRAWYEANVVDGGDFYDNVAFNAQAGIVVGSDVVNMKIGDNDAGPTVGGVTCETTGGAVANHALMVTPGTGAQFVGTRVDLSKYVLMDASFPSQIPNSAPGCVSGAVMPAAGKLGDSLGQSGCDAGFGKKIGNNDCLKSCGKAAGASAIMVAGACPAGYRSPGDTFDTPPGNSCCTLTSGGTDLSCGAGEGKRAGSDSCLPSCGKLAGAGAAMVVGACQAGYRFAGDSYDTMPGNSCCALSNGPLPGTSLGRMDCPVNHGKKVGNDDCLGSCGLLSGVGGLVAQGACPAGYSGAGDSYDAGVGNSCCRKQ